MKIIRASLLLLALLLPASHELNQREVLTKYLRAKTPCVNNTQEWSPPSVIYSSKLYGSQKGSQKEDRITALPGQPSSITFAQYSGYVTVNSKAGRALFYYFAEATEDSSTKPLLLWLNGGPGCSSFGVGAMTELGPFRVKPDNKTLYTNPYAWNNVANTLFLESPAGVGFSYSNTSSDYLHANDHRTAQDAYTFLLNWFKRFPQYKSRDFYIAGESYAGFYVPQLADVILKNNSSRTSFINLKGVMVGNGVMNVKTDSCGKIDYWWSHALISDEEYEANRCSDSSHSGDSHSQADPYKADSSSGQIDLYNIYFPLCPYHPNPIWLAIASSNSTDVVSTDGLSGFDPCTPGYVHSYLNTLEVQRALHSNVTSLPYEWRECSDVLSYTRTATTMFPIYKRMRAAGLRILVYSGDVDGVVPVTSTRYGIKAMKLAIDIPWYPWMNSEVDVGGYSVVYKGLIFATVRGAGHEVPSYQPSRALTMARFFLAGKPLPLSKKM